MLHCRIAREFKARLKKPENGYKIIMKQWQQMILNSGNWP